MRESATSLPSVERFFRGLTIVSIVAGLVFVVRHTATVLLPLAAGILLAYLLDPVVRWVQKYLKSRGGAVAMTLVTMFVGLATIAAALVPVLTYEFSAAVELLRNAMQPDSPFRLQLERRLPPELYEQLRFFLSNEGLRQAVTTHTELGSTLVVVAKKMLPELWDLVSGAFAVVGVLLQLALVIIYLVFILNDFGKFQATWPEYIPERFRAETVEFIREFNEALARYFRGQFLVALCVGLLLALGFTIVGLKLSILIGFGIGALCMVPYLQYLGGIPAFAMALLTAVESDASILRYVAGVACVFLITELLLDFVIAPRIMGKVTGVRPVILLFGVLFWGKLLGFLGVLLAIPLTCLGLAYWRRSLRVASSAG